MKKGEKIIISFIVMLFVVAYIFVSYTAPIVEEIQRQSEIHYQIRVESCNNSHTELEQHKFYLKETSIDNSISGKISGSHILIAGSVYGEISENEYINVIYFDDDTTIDETTGVYKLMKLDLENIEIVTIPKNEIPYLKYIGNKFSYSGFYSECIQGIGKPRLFLPEGWTILNTN